MEEDILKKFLEINRIKNTETMQKRLLGHNALTYAYIGDAVYELYIRTKVVSQKQNNTENYHKQSVSYVKARSQSETLKKINSMLTDEEKDIVRRGRNAKTYSVPKNATLSDYRYATAFEALIGFLYLNGNLERLNEILLLVEEGVENK